MADLRVGDCVTIPYRKGFLGEIVALYPAEPSCPPTASVRYLDGPYKGVTWGGYQSALVASLGTKP